MGLSRTVFEIAISVENCQKNSYPRVLCAPAEGELSIGAGGQKLEWWATGPTKKFDDIFSRLDTMHQRDGQTPGDSKDRAYA